MTYLAEKIDFVKQNVHNECYASAMYKSWDDVAIELLDQFTPEETIKIMNSALPCWAVNYWSMFQEYEEGLYPPSVLFSYLHNYPEKLEKVLSGK